MENWELTWTGLAPIADASQLKEEIPGVYRLSYEHEDGSYYVFYVGQATDIQQRLLEHQQPAESNTALKIYLSAKKCFFRYARISEQYVRDAVERQIYNHYQPECNTRMPEGRDDVKGNLS